MQTIDGIIEENFCLKFELDILAEVLLKNHSERWVPGYLYPSTEHSHIERYKFACGFSQGMNVIDIACGVGKGSYVLADLGGANNVSGYDIDNQAIRYANWRNKHDKVKFDVANAEEFYSDKKFTLAISFETIEHLNDYRKFLLNIKNSLDVGGTFIVSTPISAQDVDESPANKYHVREWGFNEFQNVVCEFFVIEKVFLQLYPMKAPIPVYEHRISRRIINKAKRTLLGAANNNLNNSQPLSSPKDMNSVIEEFTGQYKIDELGSTRMGYQILVVRKK